MPTRISDQDLRDVFKNNSPLSRRKIRRRLGQPPNAVMSRVLFDAVNNKVIRRVLPSEIGCGKAVVHTYTLV